MRTIAYSLFIALLVGFIACSPKKTVVEPPVTTPTETKEPPKPSKSEGFMTTRESEMIEELNLIRTDPKAYIPFVKNYIEKIQKEDFWGEDYIEQEVEAATELIEELKKTSGMPLLKADKGLYAAAAKHGKEGQQKGRLSHQGADGSMPWDRAKKYAPDIKDVSENLVGGMSDVRESVIVLLVDGGIEGRGHRKNILNPNFNLAACYEAGQVGDMPHNWIQMFGRK